VAYLKSVPVTTDGDHVKPRIGTWLSRLVKEVQWLLEREREREREGSSGLFVIQ
jgi:hypothetical protein